MNPALQNKTVLAGRILLGLLFVFSGLAKILGFHGTVGYIAAKGLPMPETAAVITILVELGGGLCVMSGFHSRVAAVGLAVFTLLAALIFHNFWAAAPAQFNAQYVNFMKNVSITGGMLLLASFGPGALSLDARRLRR